MPGSEKVYDYIVFRAADVVDLRIDDPSPEKPGVAPSEPAPVAASVRIQPWCERMKAYGCKVDFDPAVRERFFSVDSSAAFLLISPLFLHHELC